MRLFKDSQMKIGEVASVWIKTTDAGLKGLLSSKYRF